jgi:hypothetical protein
MLNLGVENDSDTFAVFIRGSLFADEEAGDDYIDNKPAAVFRITPNESVEPDPHDMPEIRVQGTGTTEFDLMDDLEELRIAILDRYADLNATELPTSIGLNAGTDYIQTGFDGYGPTNDALYLWTATQTIASPTPLSLTSHSTTVTCKIHPLLWPMTPMSSSSSMELTT